MRKTLFFVIDMILAVLAFALSYFSWQYALLPLTLISLIVAGFLFGFSALFNLGAAIGMIYLNHPQNTRDFSHEVQKRKAFAWAMFATACFFVCIAFVTNGAELISLLSYVLNL